MPLCLLKWLYGFAMASPAALAEGDGRDAHTCMLVPELWNVHGATNFQKPRSHDDRNPAMLDSSILRLIGPPPSLSCSTVKKRGTPSLED